ncbi:MAG: hypothetical protein QY326_06735 [Bdellovibrionota bacterium]|nr:MAG: hypothetical protein QY326_06735 [Bdellovibrionota bacterium]
MLSPVWWVSNESLTGYTVLLNLMRQIVAILLNEREQTKKRVADHLERLLAGRNITSSRIETGPHIERRIKEMNPAVLVLDYLLGDHGTGLDVLGQLHDLPPEERPMCFFLTDEPSISVAVEAMRLGARNYFEIDQPQALQALVREIESLNSEANLQPPQPQPFIGLSDLVAADRRSQTLLAHAESLIARNAPIVIIDGPTGSGRSVLATALVANRSSPATTKIVDYRFYLGALERIIPATFYTKGQRLISCGVDIIIEHIDDDKELFEFLAQQHRMLCPPCRIIATTQDGRVAKAWAAALGADRLSLLALADRPEDIPALAQRFVREAAQLQKIKAKPIPAADLKALLQMPWPGNVRELRNVIFTASWLPQFSSSFIEAVKQAKETLGESVNPESLDLSPEAALLALASNNANERIAAATLGCSVRSLRALSSRSTGDAP